MATVSLGYVEREVLVGDLSEDRDLEALDLCREHVERMTPPFGWSVRDHRDSARVRV